MEGHKLLKAISSDHVTIACDEKGKLLTSVELSNRFVQWANQGQSKFDFVIGGPYGLSDRVKRAADFRLSFSPMTMPHQLVRLVLIEQIYRAFTIIRNEKYHHS